MELKGTVLKDWQRQQAVEQDSEGTPGGGVAEAAGGRAEEGSMRRGVMQRLQKVDLERIVPKGWERQQQAWELKWTVLKEWQTQQTAELEGTVLQEWQRQQTVELKGTVLKELQRQQAVEPDLEGTPGGGVAEAAGGGTEEGSMRRGGMQR